MKKYFEYQLNDIPITEEQVKILKGKSLYTNYQAGDQLLRFLDHEIRGEEVYLSLKTIVERDFEQFEKEFTYIEHKNNIPMFRRK